MTALILCLALTGGRAFLLPRPALMALGALGLSLLTALFLRFPRSRRPHSRRPLSRRAARGLGLAALLALFACQALFAYHAYFIPGLDPGTLLSSAYAAAGGDGTVDQFYFNLYPNNILLLRAFTLVFRAFRRLTGGARLDRCTLILILLQYALFSAVLLLTHRLALRLSGSRRFALAAAAVCAAFVGFSPWLLIPYSDAVALLFPVLILTLYQAALAGERPALCWCAMGAAALVGYLVKPQASIPFIAVCALELVRRLMARDLKRFFATGVLLIAAFALTGPLERALMHGSGVVRRENWGVTPLHYAVMGLNEESGGGYSVEDLTRTLSETDPARLRSIQLDVLRTRLTEMGPSGLAAHLVKKTRLNFSDGTFAWNPSWILGEPVEDKDAVLSPFLKDLLGFGAARRHGALCACLEAVWLALLLGSLCAPFVLRGAGRSSGVFCALLLSLIGLALFETVFEASARYLFAFAPLYVLCGLSGIRFALCRCRRADSSLG